MPDSPPSAVANDGQPTEPPAPSLRSASITNFMRGGKDNFRADRDLAESLLGAYESYRELDRAARRFHDDRVTELAKSGITRFVDLGSSFPGLANATHETAAKSATGTTHTLYLDYDRYTLAHLRAFWADPSCKSVYTDLRNPWDLLEELSAVEPGDYLTKQTAYFLTSVAEELTTADLAALLDVIATHAAAGSYVVLTQLDDSADLLEAAQVWNATDLPKLTLRTAETLAKLLPEDRYDLIPPRRAASPISPVTAWLAIEGVPSVPVLGLVARLKETA